MESENSEKITGGDDARKSGAGKIRAALVAGFGGVTLLAAASGQAQDAKKISMSEAEATETTKLPCLRRPVGPAFLKTGHRHVEFGDQQFSVIARHNFHSPESLADLGKMLAEPVSLVFSFSYDAKDKFWKARFENQAPDKNQPFVLDLDVTYEYARDYEHASPADQKKMETEMLRKASSLFDLLLPSRRGVSFFENQIAKDHGGLQDASVNLNRLMVRGFASPESEDGLGTRSFRNQILSRLRAKNGAETLRRIFSDLGITADSIQYKGEGESELQDDEKTELLDALHVHVGGHPGTRDKILYDLVRRYNNGQMNDKTLRAVLDKTIDEKRKVAIHVEMNERRGIIMVPAPLIALLLIDLVDRIQRWRRRRRQERLLRDRLTERNRQLILLHPGDEC